MSEHPPPYSSLEPSKSAVSNKFPNFTAKDSNVIRLLFMAESSGPLSLQIQNPEYPKDEGVDKSSPEKYSISKMSFIQTAENIVVDETLPADPILKKQELDNCQKQEKDIIDKLNQDLLKEIDDKKQLVDTLKVAQKQKEEIDKCIYGFEHMISTDKGKFFASGYVNLAKFKQLRLQLDLFIHETKTKLFQKQEAFSPGSKEVEIYKLLHMAVELALPVPEYASKKDGSKIAKYKVSNLQVQVLQKAYRQFAGLLLGKSAKVETILNQIERDIEQADQDKQAVIIEKKNKLLEYKSFFDSEASHCLYIAGAFGDELAKSVASKINPLAKLCGNMVRQAIVNQYASIS